MLAEGVVRERLDFRGPVDAQCDKMDKIPARQRVKALRSRECVLSWKRETAGVLLDEKRVQGRKLEVFVCKEGAR